MGDSSKSIKDQWRALLIRSFLVGVVVTTLTFFLLKDVEMGFYQVAIRLTVQAVASCALGGVMVGLILPLVSLQGVGFHAALSAVVGSVMYFLLYHLVIPPFFPDIYFDVLANLSGAVIGGFVGGVAGSGVKRLRR
jgi:hypothetical protein